METDEFYNLYFFIARATLTPEKYFLEYHEGFLSDAQVF